MAELKKIVNITEVPKVYVMPNTNNRAEQPQQQIHEEPKEQLKSGQGNIEE